LTHLDDKGAARMVDVSAKATTAREALAECVVRMSPATLRAVREGTAKGDAIQVARVAGIMAAKRTSELIPLCHPLPLTSVTVDFEFVRGGVRVLARARVTGQTGVEMEALTAAAVAGLTLIDMTKGVEKGVYLESVRLLEKSGGRVRSLREGVLPFLLMLGLVVGLLVVSVSLGLSKFAAAGGVGGIEVKLEPVWHRGGQTVPQLLCRWPRFE